MLSYETIDNMGSLWELQNPAAAKASNIFLYG